MLGAVLPVCPRRGGSRDSPRRRLYGDGRGWWCYGRGRQHHHRSWFGCRYRCRCRRRYRRGHWRAGAARQKSNQCSHPDTGTPSNATGPQAKCENTTGHKTPRLSVPAAACAPFQADRITARFTGEVAEWSNVPDSKSGVPQGTVGSNPTLSASDFFQYFNPSNACLQAVDLIEFFLPKLPPILKKVTLCWGDGTVETAFCSKPLD